MEMEKELLLILNKINDKLDSQSQKLDEHSEILKEHSQILNEHSLILNEHSLILKEHSQILNEHNLILKEHSLLLGALRNGQEVLKAEMSELRLQVAKDFGEIRNQLKDTEISMLLIKEDCWNNRKDIGRLQKTLGVL